MTDLLKYRHSIAAASAAMLVTSIGLAAPAAPRAVKAHTQVAAFQSAVVVAKRTDPDTIRRNVSYVDLDLATTAGEQMLKRRVLGVAKGICGELTGPNGSIAQNMDCKVDAWDAARPQVARAVKRANEVALSGKSSISAAAIVISLDR